MTPQFGRRPAPPPARSPVAGVRVALIVLPALLALASVLAPLGRPSTAWAKNPKIADLEKYLKDPSSSEKVRIKVVLNLGGLGDKDAVPALAGVLAKDPVPSVRAAAAQMLGKIGDASAKAALSLALKDPDPSVRLEASKALAKLKAVGPPKMLKRSYHVMIGDILNKTKVAYGPALVDRFKKQLETRLRGMPGDFFWDRGSLTDGLVLAGSIKKVARAAAGGMTQVEVALSLVVTTNPGKKIVTIVDSEAAVGVDGAISAAEEADLAREALEAAMDDAFKGFVTALRGSE